VGQKENQDLLEDLLLIHFRGRGIALRKIKAALAWHLVRLHRSLYFLGLAQSKPHEEKLYFGDYQRTYHHYISLEANISSNKLLLEGGVLRLGLALGKKKNRN